MPTDSIQLQIVKNGGAPATGAITAAFSDSIVLGLGSTASGIKKVKYRIYEFPDGFPLPSGWTAEAANCYSVTVQNGGDAPAFALPASGNDLRGKYFFDAVGNDKRVNGRVVSTLRSKAQLAIPFSTVALEDLGYGETNEFDTLRKYVRALKKLIRVLDQAVLSGGGVTDHGALTGNSDDDHAQYEFARRPLTTPYTAASNDAALADARACIITTRATAISLRIRLQASIAWLADTLLGGINTGAGTLTITAEGGVTLNGSVTVPQNGWWWAKRTASNTWQVFTGGTSSSGGDIKSDGTVAMAADLNLGGNQAANAGDAAAATDLTTLQQVQALIAAAISTIADWKQSVRFATTAALPASTRASNVRTANANGAFPTVDGVTAIVGDRFLDKNHATSADRGYWEITDLGSAGTPWVITRTSDANTDAEVTTGMACVVEEGTANKGHVFILTTANPITVNTTGLTFTDLQALAADETTLTLAAGVLSIKALGVGNAQLATGINWSKLATAIGDLGFTGLKSLGYTGEVDNGNSGAADTIDWSAGSLQKSTLTGNATFTFTNLAVGTFYQLKLIQDGTGGRTVTWPTTTWIGQGAPSLQSTGGAVDFVTFYYDGTTLYGGSGVVSDFGTRVVRTTAQFVAATSGTPTATADGGSFESCTTSSGSLRGLCHRQASTDANGARVVLQKCRGTHASPSAHAADDHLGSMVARGHDGATFYDALILRGVADAAGGTSKRTRFESQLHNGSALVTGERATQAAQSTTNATLTTVYSVLVAADEVVSLSIRWIGKQASSSNRAVRETNLTVRRSGSGDVVAVGTSDGVPLFRDDTGWGDATQIGYTLNQTTHAVDITVQGKAATNIDWTVDVTWATR